MAFVSGSRSSSKKVATVLMLLPKLVAVGIISPFLLHFLLATHSSYSLLWQLQRLSLSPIRIALVDASNHGTKNNDIVKVGTRNTTVQLRHSSSMSSSSKQQRPPSPPQQQQQQQQLSPRQLKAVRIVGGTDTSEERYPYFVSLLNSRAQHVCGGSLVAPDLVLTAAHCVSSSSTIRWVQVGRWKRRRDSLSSSTSSSGESSGTSTTSAQSQSYDSIDDDYEEFDLDDSDTSDGNNFIVHPSYEEETNFQNDISLIHLPRQSTHPWVTMNMDPDRPYIDQYRADQERQQQLQRQPLTALGLGYTLQGDSNSVPYVLQEASLSYVANHDCEESKEPSSLSSSSSSSLPSSSLSYHGLITPDMMCASDGKIQQQDACQGDSGGPLLLVSSESEPPPSSSSSPSSETTTVADYDLLTAITSWGFGCANSNFPGVYQRLSYHSNWLRTQICQRSTSPPSYLNCHEIVNGNSVGNNDINESGAQHQQFSIPVTLIINFDSHPEDIGWVVFRLETETEIARSDPGSYSARSTAEEIIYLPSTAGTYVFSISDSRLDGLCENDFCGNYRLEITGGDNEGVVLLSGGGNFGASRQHEFELPADVVDGLESNEINSETSDLLENGKVSLTVVIYLDNTPQDVGWVIEHLGTQQKDVIHVVPGVYKTPDVKIIRTVPLTRDELFLFRLYVIGDRTLRVQLYLGTTTDIFDDTNMIFEEEKGGGKEVSHTFLSTLVAGSTNGMVPQYARGPSFLTLNIYFDLFPDEISYHIRMVRESSQSVSDSSEQDDKLIFFRPPGFFKGFTNTEVTEKIPLPVIPMNSRRQFALIVQDSRGDGLCCLWSGDRSPGYSLWYGDPNDGGEILVDSKLEMTEKEIQWFTISSDNSDSINNVHEVEKDQDTGMLGTGVELKVTIGPLDIHPDETGFYIQDKLKRRIVDIKPGTYMQHGEVIVERVTLEPGLYTFVLIDSHGDGVTRNDFRYDVEYWDPSALPIISGNVPFTSIQSHTFLVQGYNAQYPVSIFLPSTDFGFRIDRLDLIESQSTIATCRSFGGGSSYSLTVTEGGLYGIVIFDSEHHGLGDLVDDIRVVLGSDSKNVGAIERAPSHDFDSGRRWYVKFLASSSFPDTLLQNSDDSELLTIKFSFDRFPDEIAWVLLHDETVIAFNREQYGTHLAGRDYVEKIMLKKNEIDEGLSLIVSDLGGDGLCCTFGSGKVEVYKGMPSVGNLLFSDPFRETDRLVANISISSGTRGYYSGHTFW
eukprot:CAMPEP_0113509608 /NCGR_PEP_ID=MMETSP0014_2-20120614/37671_1 /TAXON_ID=2857 /ORGANISM="Nitzschia sp." /LENGTH=1244 /DNA_ID=CAMNT_0000405459 /DNA_START=1 /DNA_END=3732 /DNA_ORIENTATION=- /assembly_acc=CAM_ASM_000159